ncbi:MAG: transglutaminaseTgpA domain-containing protein [Nitriliruptoraceae bacterium]
MMRRAGLLTVLLALALLAIVPAYDRVFTDTSWRGTAVAAGLLSLLLAAVMARLQVPAVLAAVVSGIGLLVVVPWMLGIGDGWLAAGDDGWLAAVTAQWEAVRTVFADGWVALADEPSPAEPMTGLVLLTALAWWVVAHLCHEVTIRGKQVAAGLVGLTVLWTIPLAIPTSAADGWVRVVPFLAVAGALLLAGVNAREDVPQAIPLPASGLALGAVAIAVALLAPGLLPGYGAQAWVSLGSGTGPRGYQPIVDISNRLGTPEEREVLRVRSSQRTYLRLAGLDSFDGSTWRLGPPGESSYRPDPDSLYPADQPLPPEEATASSQTVEADVEVRELENIYVPLPYQPVEVLGPIRDEMVWSTEGGFLASWDNTDTVGDRIGIQEGTSYRVLAERPTPTFEDLAAVSFDEETLATHTALPRSYPELGEQAEQVYEEAGADTVVEQALALQDWFVGPEGGFTYDLDVGALRGDDALTDFVLEDRVGYCEYFATAMAVMLRETGIPARVAVGFLPGERVEGPDADEDSALDEYIVTTSDAHAWVEVLFPGHGWITFEPTPRSDASQIVPREEDLTPIENVAERTVREALEDDTEDTTSGTDETTPDTEQPPNEFDAPGGQEDDVSGGGELGDVGNLGGINLWAALLAVGVTGLLTVALTRWVQTALRRRDRDGASARSRVLAAQRRLFTVAHRVGLERAAQESTREVLARWAADGWIDRGHDRVAEVAQAAAFDGHLDEEEAHRTVATMDRLSDQLRTRVARRERLLAPLRRGIMQLRRLAETARGAWRMR